MPSLKAKILALTTANLLAQAVNESVTHVLDGEPSFSNLEACEKAVLGVKIEKKLLNSMGLPTNRNNKKMKLDTEIDGVPLDIKTTSGSNWMIPPEAVGEQLFLIKTDVANRTVSAGLFHAIPESLTSAPNRDMKVQISKVGKRSIDWLYEDISF